ncbi:minor tail protein [Mycobacterium phage LizLemon]|uniref:Minor tail protein n=1 Tax=Mycobacterium phage LizLemon TaxID=1527533 RepID=A0A076YJE8_9CAUD|nr:minor tail protein [Mycobacterium phage LizLemon]
MSLVPASRPLTDAEWARSVEQRLRELQAPRSVRVGQWAINAVGGELVATKPGESMVIGEAAPEPTKVALTRGYVKPEDLSGAIGYDDEVGAPATSFDEIKAWLQDKFYGVVDPTRIPALPWQHLFDGGVELLTDPSFAQPGTLGYDPSVGRLALGSVKFTADGSDQSRVSNLIEVVPGEKIAARVWAFFEGVTATAGQNGIRLQVRAYHLEGDTLTPVGTPTMLAGIASPSGESDDHPDEVDGWVLLSGTYTVPSGTNRIVLEPMVTSAVTAGDVWFDDGSAKKTPSGMPQAWTLDLPDDLDSLWNGVVGTVETLMAQLGLTPTGEFWDDLFDLSDEIAWIQERAAEGWQDAAQALEDLGDLAHNLLTNPAAVLGQIGQGLVEGLEDDLADAGDAIADVFDGLRDTWNRIVGGYRRTTVTGQTSQDVEEIMVSVGQEILVAQESTITLANQANAPKNVAYWETPNPFEDVSFPRALLVPELSYNVSGTTARANLGTLPANWTASVADDVEVHTHNITSLTLTPVTSRPRYTIAAGTLALSAVRIKQDRLINIARFIAGGDTPPPTALYVGLYAIDPETGNMALVHNFGDMKGDIATGAGLYETPCELPADVLVDAGTLFAVGILPVGGSFSVAAIRRQPITTSALIYPQAATELLTGQSTLPSTITESALAHTATHRIWVSVGQAVESTPEDVSPVTLSMNFDVSNTNNWSSPSFQQIGTSGSRFGIDSGAIYCASDLLAVGEEVHWRSALCLTPVHTNDHSATITLDTQFNANTYGYTTTRAYVRCNSSGTSGVAMHLDSNSAGNLRIRIANITNMTSLGTVRATATTTFAPGDDLEIRAVGSLYKVYKNGVAVPGAEWDDTAEIVPVGKAWRRHGYGLGNRNVSAFTTYRTAYIDRYVAADLVA